MKRLLLSLLCLLAVTTAALAESQTLTITPTNSGSAVMSAASTEQMSVSAEKLLTDEYVDANGAPSGFKATAFSGVYKKPNGSDYAFMMAQASGCYLALTSNEKDYTITKVEFKQNTNTGFPSDAGQEIWEFNSLDDISINAKGAISIVNPDNVEVKKITPAGVDINAKYFVLKISSIGSYQIESITIYYESNSGPKDLNLSFSSASVEMEEGQTVNLPTHTPTVGLNYSVVPAEGLTIDAVAGTMTASMVGEYTVTGSFDGNNIYTAGSADFKVVVKEHKEKFNVRFDKASYLLNIGFDLSFSLSAKDEDGSDLASDAFSIDYTIEPATGLSIENGKFVASAVGVYTVTANAAMEGYNPTSASCKVTVLDPNGDKEIVDHISWKNAYLANGSLASDDNSTAYRDLTWQMPSGAEYAGFALTAYGSTKALGIKFAAESGVYSGIYLTNAPEGYKLGGVKYVMSSKNTNKTPFNLHYGTEYYTSGYDIFTSPFSIDKVSTSISDAVDGVKEVVIPEGVKINRFGFRPSTFQNSDPFLFDEIVITWVLDEPEVALTWKDVDESLTINKVFEFSVEEDGSVTPNLFTLELACENEDISLDDFEIYKVKGSNVEATDENGKFHITGPGNAEFAVKVKDDSYLAQWNVDMPEHVTLNVAPAKIAFTEFENGLKVEHIQTEYVANSGKHDNYGSYVLDLKEDSFVATPSHIDALNVKFVPEFTPEWDGVLTDEMIDKIEANLPADTTLADRIEECHAAYHHLAYVEPVVDHLSENGVDFEASVAGKYKLQFTLKDAYKGYFEECGGKEYDFELTPELLDNTLSFYEAGSYNTIKNAIYNGTNWNLTYLSDGSTDHLKRTHVATNHGGKLYYRVSYGENPEVSAIAYAAGADEAADGYTLYDVKGIDLRNAKKLEMYQVVNGAKTGVKTIEFSGSIPTGVDEIGSDALDSDAEYYTLEGLQVQLPLAPGAYVCRKSGRGIVIFVK